MNDIHLHQRCLVSVQTYTTSDEKYFGTAMKAAVVRAANTTRTIISGNAEAI
jgi:hypothetical protein